MIAVAEEESTKHPLIDTGSCGFQGQLLTKNILAHPLLHPIVVLRREVLVNAHKIVDILVSRLTVETNDVTHIAGIEACGGHLTQVGTIAVIVDLAGLSCLGIVDSIGITTLIAVAIAHVSRKRPPSDGFPKDTSAQETVVELVYLTAVEGIAEETVVMVITAIDGKAETIAQLCVVIGIHHEVVIASVASLDTCALKLEG